MTITLWNYYLTPVQSQQKTTLEQGLQYIQKFAKEVPE